MWICSEQFGIESYLQQQSLYESARCFRMNYSKKDFQVNSVKLVFIFCMEQKGVEFCEVKNKPQKASLLKTPILHENNIFRKG